MLRVSEPMSLKLACENIAVSPLSDDEMVNIPPGEQYWESQDSVDYEIGFDRVVEQCLGLSLVTNSNFGGRKQMHSYNKGEV